MSVGSSSTAVFPFGARCPRCSNACSTLPEFDEPPLPLGKPPGARSFPENLVDSSDHTNHPAAAPVGSRIGVRMIPSEPITVCCAF